MNYFKPRTTVAFLLGLAALGLAAQAHAHGDNAHSSMSANVKAQQQAWGIAAGTKTAARRIEVGMSDAMRFTPSLIEVKLGETIKFVIKNEGQVLHEFVLGTEEKLAEHAAMMVKFPNMEHDEPYMAHVLPGKTGEINWTFNRAGEFDFACLIAGHFQAGMVGKIKVLATQPAAKPGK
jgi:uncharacterized cupredoxin-like copper-binding protein